MTTPHVEVDDERFAGHGAHSGADGAPDEQPTSLQHIAIQRQLRHFATASMTIAQVTAATMSRVVSMKLESAGSALCRRKREAAGCCCAKIATQKYT